ncbi:hypothetical protein V8F20_010919 [Naviculisporaceae sp. PSN 640]
MRLRRSSNSPARLFALALQLTVAVSAQLLQYSFRITSNLNSVQWGVPFNISWVGAPSDLSLQIGILSLMPGALDVTKILPQSVPGQTSYLWTPDKKTLVTKSAELVDEWRLTFVGINDNDHPDQRVLSVKSVAFMIHPGPGEASNSKIEVSSTTSIAGRPRPVSFPTSSAGPYGTGDENPLPTSSTEPLGREGHDNPPVPTTTIIYQPPHEHDASQGVKVGVTVGGVLLFAILSGFLCGVWCRILQELRDRRAKAAAALIGKEPDMAGVQEGSASNSDLGISQHTTK